MTYTSVEITRDNGVATIQMFMDRRAPRGGSGSHHSEVGRALNELRFDNSIRVVVLTGADLHRMGIINRAVPAEMLDLEVQKLAEDLLRRPAYALALSKRAFNKFITDRFNATFDLAWAYEALNFYQFGRYVDGHGDKTL